LAVEIELKAWVDDPGTLKKRIPRGARCGGSYKKHDQYWLVPPEYGVSAENFPSGIRIRNETGENGGSSRCRICFKTKEMRDAVEVNHEREFDVSDSAVFTEFLKKMGLRPGRAKVKTGWAWEYEGITIELSLVDGLGWFVELEILAQNDAAPVVEESRKRLLALLSLLGIGEDRIERRYYTELLGV
jgi:adenylate cyclase class 2